MLSPRSQRLQALRLKFEMSLAQRRNFLRNAGGSSSSSSDDDDVTSQDGSTAVACTEEKTRVQAKHSQQPQQRLIHSLGLATPSPQRLKTIKQEAAGSNSMHALDFDHLTTSVADQKTSQPPHRGEAGDHVSQVAPPLQNSEHDGLFAARMSLERAVLGNVHASPKQQMGLTGSRPARGYKYNISPASDNSSIVSTQELHSPLAQQQQQQQQTPQDWEWMQSTVQQVMVLRERDKAVYEHKLQKLQLTQRMLKMRLDAEVELEESMEEGSHTKIGQDQTERTVVKVGQNTVQEKGRELKDDGECADAGESELERRIQERIEQRLEQRLEQALEQRLVQALEQRLQQRGGVPVTSVAPVLEPAVPATTTVALPPAPTPPIPPRSQAHIEELERTRAQVTMLLEAAGREQDYAHKRAHVGAEAMVQLREAHRALIESNRMLREQLKQVQAEHVATVAELRVEMGEEVAAAKAELREKMTRQHQEEMQQALQRQEETLQTQERTLRQNLLHELQLQQPAEQQLPLQEQEQEQEKERPQQILQQPQQVMQQYQHQQQPAQSNTICGGKDRHRAIRAKVGTQEATFSEPSQQPSSSTPSFSAHDDDIFARAEGGGGHKHQQCHTHQHQPGTRTAVRVVRFDRGRIGIDVDDCMRVTAVADESQAHRHCVQEGDEIRAVNGVPARGAIEQLMQERGLVREDGSTRRVRDEFLKLVKAMPRPIEFQIVSVEQHQQHQHQYQYRGEETRRENQAEQQSRRRMQQGGAGGSGRLDHSTLERMDATQSSLKNVRSRRALRTIMPCAASSAAGNT
jgi:hypothetical protein